MDSLLIAILTAFIGCIAWTTRFAINEYPVFKKLKIPSTIFKYGSVTIFIYLIWNISANYVYSRMLPYVNIDKIKEMNSAIYFRADTKSSIIFITSYVFIWFIAISIDRVAESINKARKEHEEQQQKNKNYHQ